MHARHQLEFAGWIASQSELILNTIDRPDAIVMDSFWISMKARNAAWNIALKTFEADLQTPSRDFNPWPALEIILEEVIVAESLTRIWAAFVLALEEQWGICEQGPLAQSAFISHMETRNRVMRLLLRSRGDNEPAFDRFNQLRRSVEKWTDLFLGLIANRSAAEKFAFDAKRHEDFSREQQSSGPGLDSRRIQIWLGALEKSFLHQCRKWSANPEMNRRIIESIVACIPDIAFEVSPPSPCIIALWKDKAHATVQALVDRLSTLDS